MPTVKLLEKRDKKEAELRASFSNISICDLQKKEKEQEYAYRFELYQKWKLENGVDGIDF